MTRRQSRLLACTALVCLAAVPGRDPIAQSGPPLEITFPTSGSAHAQPLFLRGVAALHDFEYEDAIEAFQEAQKIDRGFAMAYWGEAMTYNQTLWRRENVDAAREALARLRSNSNVASLASTERAFIAAVEVLFGEGDFAQRRSAYADAMARFHASEPDNPEVAAFHALALLGTMSRSLIGYVDTTEGHSHGLAGSETQKQVAAILEKVLATHPRHPGALHYLLHNYDDPEHARLALEAARAYATIARSSHALHMPAHIFFQLGRWHDAVPSDRAAFDASTARVKARNLSPTLNNYHALSWLQYELLQLGRYREAWATLGEIEPVVKSSGLLPLLSNLSSMRGRYVVESRRWDLLARERNFGNVNELFAIGMSAARSGNPSLAEMARAGLAERSQSEQEGDLRPAIAIMEREVAALIDLAAGRSGEAVEILQAAANAELRLPPPLGLPVPIKPAPELLGETLVELGRARDAREWFERALARNPNRSLSVLGLARMARASGDTDEAKRHYRQLLANFDRADKELPELQEARAAIDGSSVPATRVPGAVPTRVQGAIPIAVCVAALIAIALLIRRSTRRARVTESRGARRRRALGRR